MDTINKLKLFSYEIPARVVPKARPRFTSGSHKNAPNINYRGRMHVYNPIKTKQFEMKVKSYCHEAMVKNRIKCEVGPVFLDIVFMFHQKVDKGCAWHSSKPDLDNCIKSIKDGMNNIAYDDDCQVAGLHAIKVYGEENKVIVDVYKLLED